MNENNSATVISTRTDQVKPWDGITLPIGYRLNAQGVFKQEGDNFKRICGPIWITAKTRSNRRTDWGIVLHWIDHDGQLHERAVPVRQLHEARGTLPQDLAADGLAIVSGQERALLSYLTDFDTDARLNSVNRLGWIDNETDQLRFVLPAREKMRVIGDTTNHSVIFQPEQNLPSLESMHESGTLMQWKNHVAHYCQGNPVLLLALCAGLGAPLLRFMETEGGVFHIYGPSSTGKTTALQVGASIWGCGADPGASSISHIRRWNSTTNALEATAAAYNDTLLLLDEMGSSEAQDFGKVIYDLVSGQGKSRLDKNATLKVQRFARVLALSTGEISLAERMAQDQRRKLLAGHQTRFVDIATQANIIVNDHHLGGRELATRLKQNCGHYYGTAGPAFVEALINRYATPEDLRQAVRDAVEISTRNLKRIHSLSAHQERALQRFALALTAGIMAVQLGILPFTENELKTAFEELVDQWIGQSMSEGQRGIRNVVNFFLRNEIRFGSIYDPNNRPRDMAGYYNRKNGRIYFTDEGFKEACSGSSPDIVFEEIRKHGYAISNDSQRRKCKVTVRQMKEKALRIWMYGVSASIVEME